MTVIYSSKIEPLRRFPTLLSFSVDHAIFLTQAEVDMLQEAVHDSDTGGVDHAEDAKDYQSYVGGLGVGRLGEAASQVQVRRVDVDERHTGKGADEGDKAVEAAGG